MKTELEEKIKYYILKKLDRQGYWGRRPINFDDLKHPKISKKDMEDICNKLVKENLLIKKPGNYGWRYGLNPANKEKILKEIRRRAFLRMFLAD